MESLSFGEGEDAPGIEREKNDRRAGHDRTQALLAGVQDFVLPDALRDVTGVDDHAIGVGLIESCLSDRLQHAPGAVRMLEPERRRMRGAWTLDRIRQGFHHGREIVGMHELERVASQQLAGAVPEQALDRGADVAQDAIVSPSVERLLGYGASELLGR